MGLSISMPLGKPEFDVRPNRRETAFAKADDEQYMFERSKLVLTQASIVTIDARVESQVVDKTRRWSIGVDYGKHGIAYTVDFPLGHERWGGWMYKDDNGKAGGVAMKF